jgi:hypothetical protein
MEAGTTIERFCGIKTRKGRGTPCRKPAGWGTPTPGRGPCRLHGGMLPGVRKVCEAQEADAFAREVLQLDVPIDPLQAKLLAVRLAAGLKDYWTRRWAKDGPTDTVVAGYERALDKLDRFSKTALDAGVAEKLVALAEREADPIVLAAEEALAVLKGLTATERTAFAVALKAGLERHFEPIEGTALELPA